MEELLLLDEIDGDYLELEFLLDENGCVRLDDWEMI